MGVDNIIWVRRTKRIKNPKGIEEVTAQATNPNHRDNPIVEAEAEIEVPAGATEIETGIGIDKEIGKEIAINTILKRNK